MTVLRLYSRFMMNYISNGMIQNRHCNWWRQTLWLNSKQWPVLTQNFVSSHLLQLNAVKLCWECMRKLKSNGGKHVWCCMMLPRTHKHTQKPLLKRNMKSYAHSRGLVMPWVTLDINCNSSYQVLWTTRFIKH